MVYGVVTLGNYRSKNYTYLYKTDRRHLLITFRILHLERRSNMAKYMARYHIPNNYLAKKHHHFNKENPWCILKKVALLTSPSKLDVASKLGGHETTDKISSWWPFVCLKRKEEVIKWTNEIGGGLVIISISVLAILRFNFASCQKIKWLIWNFILNF